VMEIFSAVCMATPGALVGLNPTKRVRRGARAMSEKYVALADFTAGASARDAW
jgi:hypothetical protein